MLPSRGLALRPLCWMHSLNEKHMGVAAVKSATTLVKHRELECPLFVPSGRRDALCGGEGGSSLPPDGTPEMSCIELRSTCI